MISQRDFLISIQTEFGHGLGAIKKVLWQLKRHFKFVAASSVYRVVPEDDVKNFPYLSLVVRLSSELTLLETAQRLAEIEARLREEFLKQKCSIKFLTYGYEITTSQKCSLPDPDLHLNPELLIPCAEVWPQYVHPVLSKSLKELTLNLLAISPIIEFYSQGGALLDFSVTSD